MEKLLMPDYDKLFYADFKANLYKTYSDLLNDLTNLKSGKSYIFEKDTYNVFLQLLHSLICDYPVTMLDSDFSETEMCSLGIEPSLISSSFSSQTNKIDLDGLINNLLSVKSNWSLTLYTSGTTGRPKKVQHSFANLTRFVKINEKHSSNIWAFAYNPTHLAGLQVFFQAILNLNSLINIANVEKKDLDLIFDKFAISNISATPTFYRFILPFLQKEYKTVKKCTMGGEKFDQSLTISLHTKFPDTKFVNIYASTEAGSLFVSDGDYFIIPENIKQLISVSQDNELLINNALLGNGEFKLISDSGWYATGDIVEADQELTKFKVVSRNTEMINVGGYKVNPHEVENCLKQIDGIQDALVYGRKNSVTGNIIAADIINNSKLNDDDLRQEIINLLKLKLQEWKIPRILKFVDTIQVGRTGKKVRK